MHTPSVQHGYTTGAAGTRLHYLDYGGSGPTAICLHGVIGNAWNWHEVATGLASQRRVVALDFRGYGESQWSPDHAYTTADHAADVGAVIDALGEERVDLYGSSWGALTAIQYAVDNPERVANVVVVDVEASFAQSETDLFPRPTSFATADEVRADTANSFPNASQDMVDLIAATCFAPSDGGQLVPKHDPYFFERWPFRADDHWDRLSKLEASTLFVHAADSFVNGDVMEDMASRVKDAQYAEVSPSTHVIPVDNASGLLDAMRPFLGG